MLLYMLPVCFRAAFQFQRVCGARGDPAQARVGKEADLIAAASFETPQPFNSADTPNQLYTPAVLSPLCMSSSSSLKGKARAADEPSPRAQSPRTQSKLRQGRGPIIHEDDDHRVLVIDHQYPANGQDDEDDERVGLLHPSSREGQHPIRTRSSWSLCLLTATLSTAFAVLILFALVHLWIGHVISEQSREGSLEQSAQRAVILDGPYHVALGEAQHENQVITTLSFSLGVDVQRGLNWEDKDGKRASILHRWEARFARQFVKRADSVLVNLDRFELLDTDGNILLVVPSLDPITVPLSYPDAGGQVHLTPLSVEVPLRFPDPESAAKFGQAVWRKRKYDVTARVGNVEWQFVGGQRKGFFGFLLRKGQGSFDQVQASLSGKG